MRHVGDIYVCLDASRSSIVVKFGGCCISIARYLSTYNSL